MFTFTLKNVVFETLDFGTILLTYNCKLQVYATQKSRFFSDFDHIFLRNLHIVQGLRGFFFTFYKRKTNQEELGSAAYFFCFSNKNFE